MSTTSSFSSLFYNLHLFIFCLLTSHTTASFSILFFLISVLLIYHFRNNSTSQAISTQFGFSSPNDLLPFCVRDNSIGNSQNLSQAHGTLIIDPEKLLAQTAYRQAHKTCSHHLQIRCFSGVTCLTTCHTYIDCRHKSIRNIFQWKSGSKP